MWLVPRGTARSTSPSHTSPSPGTRWNAYSKASARLGTPNISLIVTAMSYTISCRFTRLEGGSPHGSHTVASPTNTKSQTGHVCSNLALPGLQWVNFRSWYIVAGSFSPTIFPCTCEFTNFTIISALFHGTPWLTTRRTRSFAKPTASTPSSEGNARGTGASSSSSFCSSSCCAGGSSCTG